MQGFGHKINEGLSCGAVVLAPAGPPMNELVRPERGFLVQWNATSPKAPGTEYHFDEADFERTIERCLALTPDEIEAMTTKARAWFEENDRYFRQTLPDLLRNLVATGTPSLQLLKG